MSLGVLEKPVVLPKTGQGEGHVAHIVKSHDDKKSAGALVTEARVMGIELEALCGHRWIPSRDTKGLPVCQACKEIWEARYSNRPTPEGA